MLSKVKAKNVRVLVKAGKVSNAVYLALMANHEQGGFVNLANAQDDLQGLVSPAQFAGSLGALEKEGKYKPLQGEYKGHYGKI